MKRWNKKEIKYLIENYHKKSISELSKFLDRTYKSITIKAYRLNLLQDKNIAYKSRTYSCNDNFFSYPNILNSYWAGFIGADGCVMKNKRLSINISLCDIILLERFKKDINFNGNIRLNSARYYNNSLTKESVCLSLTSKKIIEDLFNNFNICSNKSLILKPPNIDDEKALSYIIGNIDGDGSIFINKQKRLFLYFVGTYNLLYWIKDILSNICVTNNNICKNNNIYTLSYTNNSAFKIIQTLKKVNVEKLSRKWEKI